MQQINMYISPPHKPLPHPEEKINKNKNKKQPFGKKKETLPDGLSSFHPSPSFLLELLDHQPLLPSLLQRSGEILAEALTLRLRLKLDFEPLEVFECVLSLDPNSLLVQSESTDDISLRISEYAGFHRAGVVECPVRTGSDAECAAGVRGDGVHQVVRDEDGDDDSVEIDNKSGSLDPHYFCWCGGAHGWYSTSKHE